MVQESYIGLCVWWPGRKQGGGGDEEEYGEENRRVGIQELMGQELYGRQEKKEQELWILKGGA